MDEKINLDYILTSYKEKTVFGMAWEVSNGLQFRRDLTKAPLELIDNIHIGYTVNDGEQEVVKLVKVGNSNFWTVFKDRDVYFNVVCDDDRLLIDDFTQQLKDKLFPPPDPDFDANVSMNP